MQAVIPLAIAAAISFAPAARAQPSQGTALFDGLIGRWRCSGSFAGTGKEIAATLVVTRDDATDSLMLHHDDLPPNGYHALELWGPSKVEPYRATIADRFGGIRWFTSTGWADGALEWVRSENGQAKEIFRYSHLVSSGFDVDWYLVAPDGRRVLGDHVSCERV
jgi:hypothetical protein